MICWPGALHNNVVTQKQTKNSPSDSIHNSDVGLPGYIVILIIVKLIVRVDKVTEEERPQVNQYLKREIGAVVLAALFYVAKMRKAVIYNSSFPVSVH